MYALRSYYEYRPQHHAGGKDGHALGGHHVPLDNPAHGYGAGAHGAADAGGLADDNVARGVQVAVQVVV